MRLNFPYLPQICSVKTAVRLERPVWVLCIVAILGSTVTSSSGGSDQKQMPLGIENLRLGMKLDELVTLRNVQESSCCGTNGMGSARIWSERNLTNDYFDSALYRVGDAGQIEVVTTVRQCPSAVVKDRARGFVKACIQRWGNAFVVKTAEIRHSGRVYIAPVLVWDKGEFSIAVTYTPSEACVEGAQAMFQTTVFTKEVRLSELFRVKEEEALRFREEVRSLAKP